MGPGDLSVGRTQARAAVAGGEGKRGARGSRGAKRLPPGHLEVGGGAVRGPRQLGDLGEQLGDLGFALGSAFSLAVFQQII